MKVKDIRGLALACAILLAALAWPPALALPAEPAAAPGPAEGIDPGDLARLPDRQLLLVARRLLQAGRPAPACEVLASFFQREERNTELDWEAAIFREGCRAPAGVEPAATPARPGAARAPAPRLNAVQVFVFEAPAPDRLDRELGELRARGVDTIIVRAFHNAGDRPLFRELPVSGPGVYFATEHAPLAADCLATVARAAHARGLRVFGWMTTRKCDWLIDSHPEWLESQYDPDLGRSVPSRSLSLFRPEVRQKLRRVFHDLAATGVDGILFQDDLIMRWNEGFSGPAEQSFLDATGKVVHPDDLFVLPAAQGKVPGFRPLFREWCVWKSRAVLEFLGDLAAEARRVRPTLLIAANVYYESLLKPEQGLAWYAQDAAALAGAADYLALMSYHRQITTELSLDEGKLRELLAEAVRRARSLAIDEARIIFKIQTTDWETGQPIPEAEWGEVRRGFQKAGGFSMAVLQH